VVREVGDELCVAEAAASPGHVGVMIKLEVEGNLLPLASSISIPSYPCSKNFFLDHSIQMCYFTVPRAYPAILCIVHPATSIDENTLSGCCSSSSALQSRCLYHRIGNSLSAWPLM
jgi:hypothetical protein